MKLQPPPTPAGSRWCAGVEANRSLPLISFLFRILSILIHACASPSRRDTTRSRVDNKIAVVPSWSAAMQPWPRPRLPIRPQGPLPRFGRYKVPFPGTRNDNPDSKLRSLFHCEQECVVCSFGGPASLDSHINDRVRAGGESSLVIAPRGSHSIESCSAPKFWLRCSNRGLLF